MVRGFDIVIIVLYTDHTAAQRSEGYVHLQNKAAIANITPPNQR